MIITCPACTTRYNVGENTVSGKARRVRCKKCAHEWVIEPEGAESPAAVAAPAPEAPAEPTVPGSATLRATKSAPAERRQRAKRGTDWRRPLINLDRLASLFVALLVLAAIAWAAVGFKARIVRAWPASAGLYAAIGVKVNALGIEIRNTSWTIAQVNGLPVLTIKGEIVNTTSRSVALPELQLTLRDDKAHALVRWSAVLKAKQLKPGETVRFTQIRQSPPSEAHDVEIRFATGA